MTRHAEPNAKSYRLVIEAKNEDEKETIRGFKKVCVLDRMELKEEILKLIKIYFFPKHNYPPGNPQTTIIKFGVQTEITQKCEHPTCIQTAVYEDTPKSPYAKPKIFYCKAHHEQAKEKGLLRSSRKL